MKKHLHIGLFGFGTVGRGLYDVLQRIGAEDVTIERICVRKPSQRPRSKGALHQQCRRPLQRPEHQPHR